MQKLAKKCVLILGLAMSQSAVAGDSLTGPGGLLLTPTAEFPVDRQVGVGTRYLASPNVFIQGNDVSGNYLFYANLVYLPRLEVTLLFTMAPGRPGNDGSDVYKDAAVFAQIYLLQESESRPALALGIHDFYSFSFYNALFMVMSKSFDSGLPLPLRVHLGYGTDWLDEHYGDTGIDRSVPVPHHLVGFFGGLEAQISKKLELILEYDTNNLNTGIRVQLPGRVDFVAALLDFESFAAGINYQFRI